MKPRIGTARFACGAEARFEYVTEMERRAIIGNIERRGCPACVEGIPPEAPLPDAFPPDAIAAAGTWWIERPEQRRKA